MTQVIAGIQVDGVQGDADGGGAAVGIPLDGVVAEIDEVLGAVVDLQGLVVARPSTYSVMSRSLVWARADAGQQAENRNKNH